MPKLKGKSVDIDENGLSVGQLLESDRLIDKAELHERLAPAMVVVVLMLLGLSISKTSPRDAKYGSLILGLLIYIVYLNLLTIALSLIKQGKVPPSLGTWWVHALFIGYGFWRIHKADNFAKKP